MSAGISSVGTQVVENDPSCTKELMKWCQMSICLEQAEIAGEWESAQAA